MKITRIEIEGARAKASITREDLSVVITVAAGRKQQTWRFYSRVYEDQAAQARRLQRALDGYVGTAGDVAEYLQVIQTFCD